MSIWNTFTEHHFELSGNEKEQFEHFLSLFQEYNSHTNLSAIRDEEGIVAKHFVDSLYGASVIEDLKNTTGTDGIRMLDIGSG